MALTIYPAIDLLGGKCVRLEQGDYQKNTIYSEAPVEMGQMFAREGAEWLHVVDLDGAKQKKRVNETDIIEIARNVNVPVQVGGGIRTESDIDFYLSQGVSRVILGSVAVNHLSFTEEMIRKYGKQIVIGIDARDGYVATEGWLETSSVKAEELVTRLKDFGVSTIIYTDIAKDGMLEGPNIAACERIAATAGDSIHVIASGGVGDLADIEKLTYSKASGAIIGKALYAKRFSLEEAIAVGRKTHAN